MPNIVLIYAYMCKICYKKIWEILYKQLCCQVQLSGLPDLWFYAYNWHFFSIFHYLMASSKTLSKALMWTALKVKMQLCLHHLLLCLVVVLLNVNSWCQCNHSCGRSCCMRSPVLLIRLRFCCRRATCVHNLGTSCLCPIYEVWHLCYTSLLGMSFELELY